MRKKMILVLALTAAVFAPHSFAETTNQGYEDEGLAFSIQAKQGGPWAPLKSHMNSAARVCIYGSPRCYGQKGKACQPYAMKIEGPGGQHEMKCMATKVERGNADLADLQNDYERARVAAKGQ